LKVDNTNMKLYYDSKVNSQVFLSISNNRNNSSNN